MLFIKSIVSNLQNLAQQFLEWSTGLELGNRMCQRSFRGKVSRHISASFPVWLQNCPCAFETGLILAAGRFHRAASQRLPPDASALVPNR